MSTHYSWRQLKQDLSKDIASYLKYSGEYHDVGQSWKQKISSLLIPSVFACCLYRLSHWAYCHNVFWMAIWLARFNLWLTGVSISPNSQIGGGFYIAHPVAIVFQGYAGTNFHMFAGSAVLEAQNVPFCISTNTKSVHIGNNVALGAKAVICGNVTIGDNVKVGFNTYVDSDIPSNVIVVNRHIRNKSMAS